MDKNAERANNTALAISLANRALARTRKHMQADLERFINTIDGKLPPSVAVAAVTQYMSSLTIIQAHRTLSMHIGGPSEAKIKRKIVVSVLATMCSATGFTSRDMAELCNDASIELAEVEADQATVQ